MSSDFQYLPLSPDPLPGKSFEEQTEMAINELSDRISDVEDDPRVQEALDTANVALSTATEAIETANAAETSATAANNTANTALAQTNINTTDIVDINIRLGDTYDIAVTANSTAESALQVANNATDVANTALTTSQTADNKADTAVATSDAALQIANKSLYYTIVTGVDFNELYISANWYINDTVSLNMPVAVKGFLTVRSDTSNIKVLQTYHTTNNDIYSRSGTITDNGTTLTVAWDVWTKSSGDLDLFLTKNGLTLLDDTYIPSQPQGISTKKYVDDRFSNQVAVLPPATLYITTTNLVTAQPTSNVARPIALVGTTATAINSTYTFPQAGFVSKDSKYNLELYFTNLSVSATYTIVAKWVIKGIVAFTQTEIFQPTVANYESVAIYVSSLALADNVSYVAGDTATLTLTVNKDTGGNSTINLASNVATNQFSTLNREGSSIYTTSVLDDDGTIIRTQREINVTTLSATSSNVPNTIVKRDANGNFSAGTITANLAGNADTATKSTTCTGNSATATKLITSRNIALTGDVTGNANFDGSGNINIITTVSASPVSEFPVGFMTHNIALLPGFVRANGAEILRTSYPRLWDWVNANNLAKTEAEWVGGLQGYYSVGDGSTTFRVPDLRGEVIRGLDDGRGLDVGRVLGSHQEDAIRNITGEFSVRGLTGGLDEVSGCVGVTGTSGSNAVSSPVSAGISGHAVINSSFVVPTAEENRVKNIAYISQIKF